MFLSLYNYDKVLCWNVSSQSLFLALYYSEKDYSYTSHSIPKLQSLSVLLYLTELVVLSNYEFEYYYISSNSSFSSIIIIKKGIKTKKKLFLRGKVGLF